MLDDGTWPMQVMLPVNMKQGAFQEQSLLSYCAFALISQCSHAVSAYAWLRTISNTWNAWPSFFNTMFYGYEEPLFLETIKWVWIAYEATGQESVGSIPSHSSHISVGTKCKNALVLGVFVCELSQHSCSVEKLATVLPRLRKEVVHLHSLFS